MSLTLTRKLLRNLYIEIAGTLYSFVRVNVKPGTNVTFGTSASADGLLLDLTLNASVPANLVTGPAGATDGHVALFDGATGHAIKDGGALGTAAFQPTTAFDAAGAAAAALVSAKAYADGLVVGLLDLKGGVDCSGNPNYPAALKGDAYYVTVAGKIGGAAGLAVDIGDVIAAVADNAGGTQAGVGASWIILEHNLAGALLASNNLSDVADVVTAFNNLSGMTTLGDILYGGAAGTRTRLAGNTTATRKFLRQTGDGANSAAPAWDTVTKADVGLNLVENTALSTWAGSTNLTTLGTIATGTWQGSAIADAYIASAGTWNATVPNTRTINGKQLNANITLAAFDVGVRLSSAGSGFYCGVMATKEANPTISATVVKDTLFAFPFTPDTPMTLDRIGVWVGAASLMGNVSYGICSDSGGVPGTILAQGSSALNVAANTMVTATISQALVPGTKYWFIVVWDANAQTSSSTCYGQGKLLQAFKGFDSTATSGYPIGLKVAYSWANPIILPSFAAPTNILSNDTFVGAVWFRRSA